MMREIGTFGWDDMEGESLQVGAWRWMIRRIEEKVDGGKRGRMELEEEDRAQKPRISIDEWKDKKLP
jgi:hypothetical protein